MNHSVLILHPCGYFDTSLIDTVSADLEKEFSIRVEHGRCNLDISRFYDPGRRQYNANELMKSLHDIVAERDDARIMGLLRVDLYVPILTYIFGQAELGGKTGLASLYRLRSELYGLEINNKLLLERFRKVVMHEAGHLSGLIHCHNPVCIMRSSTYVEDIDQKDLWFCDSCRQKLDDGKDSASSI